MSKYFFVVFFEDTFYHKNSGSIKVFNVTESESVLISFLTTYKGTKYRILSPLRLKSLIMSICDNSPNGDKFKQIESLYRLILGDFYDKYYNVVVNCNVLEESKHFSHMSYLEKCYFLKKELKLTDSDLYKLAFVKLPRYDRCRSLLRLYKLSLLIDYDLRPHIKRFHTKRILNGKNIVSLLKTDTPLKDIAFHLNYKLRCMVSHI